LARQDQPSPFLQHDRSPSRLTAGWLGAHGDGDIVVESVEELEEPLNGEMTRPATHQRGDVWLLNSKNLARAPLGERSVSNETVDL
jgi:hypothetical protein